MYKKLLIGAAIAMAMSSAAHAETYKFDKNTVTMEIKGGNITGKTCHEDSKCLEAAMPVADLIKDLEKKIELYKEGMADEKALIADAKKQASAKDAQIIDDKEAKKKYVMIKAMNGDLMLPIDSESVKKGDFSLLKTAAGHHIKKMESTIELLKGGKLPESFDAKDDYSKFEPINSLFFLTLKSSRKSA